MGDNPLPDEQAAEAEEMKDRPVNITDGVPSEIYVAIGRNRYENEYELARDVAFTVRAKCRAEIERLRRERNEWHAKYDTEFTARINLQAGHECGDVMGQYPEAAEAKGNDDG